MSPERFKHYTVGIPEIDADHLALLADSIEIGRLISAKKYDDASVLFNLVLDTLRQHWIAEEEFLRAIDYKFIGPHIADHTAMLKTLSALNISDLTNAIAISDFKCKIEMILINHIDNYDRQYIHDAVSHPELFAIYQEHTNT